MIQLVDPNHYRETFLIAPIDNVRPIARIIELGRYKSQRHRWYMHASRLPYGNTIAAVFCDLG